jgi:CRP-like cAMP-binding protein
MQDSTEFIADAGLIAELEKRSELVRFRGGSLILFHQGDPPGCVYILRRGTVRLTMRSETGQVVFRIQVGPGSLLGLPAVISNKPCTLTAEALEHSEVSVVCREDFADMIRTNPEMSFKALQVLAAEVRSMRHALLKRGQ